jgi:predicted permease
LGASTTDIVRQFVIQTLLLVGTAGVAALFLAWLILPVLKQLNPDPSLASLLGQVRIETVTVSAAIAVILLAGILSGLLPAWQTRSVALETALRSQSRGGGASFKAVRWQQAMIVTQAAIAVLILASAVIAGVTLFKLTQVHLGFQTQDRIVFRIQLPEPAIDTHEKRVLFARALEQNLASETALKAYGFTTTLPVGDTSWGGSYLPQLGSGEYASEPSVFQLRRVSAGYIASMGIPLVQGRLFNDRDRIDRTPVAIVSKTLAAKYWPNGDAIGHKLRRAGPPGTEFEIVGIVDDVRDNGPADVVPETLYIPYEQFSHRHLSIVLAVHHSVADAIAAGRRALRASNPDVAAFDIATLDSLASQTLALPRLQFALLAGFGILAVLITALGAYGVMSQVVGVREKELAIRSALGATRSNVVRLIAWQNAKLATFGIIGGVVAAWFASRSLQATIPTFQSTPVLEPLVLVGLIILCITQLAGILPLRRAIRPGLHRLLGSA